MKTMFRLLAVVFCLFSITNHLQAQWVQTSGPYGGSSVEAFAVSGANIFVGTRGD